MSRKIFKYVLPFLEKSYVDLPKGAEVIRIDGMDGFLFLWAIVEVGAETERREFLLFKTGAPIPDGKELKYLGCGAIFVQMELMMYVFEEVRHA